MDIARSYSCWCRLLIVVCLVSPLALAAVAERPPNIVIILTDDQGWGDVTSHGNDVLETPVLDKLAADGARFDRFYVSPVCAPTRASLLTGRYALRTGVSGVTHGKEYMRTDEVTLADVLRQAGYATGCFGKWHNGDVYPYHPNGRGFDTFTGFCAGHWNNYFDMGLEHNGEKIETEGYISDVLTDAAVAFIEAHREKPFLCYVPYNVPHSPFQVPDAHFDKYKAEGLDDTLACVYAMCEHMDACVGRILKTLDRLALAENTIIVFLGDNGPNTDRYNGGMRGRKGSVHEGGVRQATFVRWPGRIDAGMVVDGIAAHIDLLPTLAELTDVSMPKTKPLDGVSLAPQLLGGEKADAGRRIFSHWAGRMAVRTQTHRLVIEKGRAQLFDMVADPGQTKDISKGEPELAAELRQACEAWYAEASQEGLAPPPLPVGFSERPCVELLAPAAKLAGGVYFKGVKGWANDWVSGWDSTDASVSWEVDVVEAGTYAVSLEYVCKDENVGARMAVSMGGVTVTAVVEEAHDPAPMPSPDRVERKEVYEKEWATLPVGEVDVAAGRATLTVRAGELMGSEAIDLKGVRVCRVE